MALCKSTNFKMCVSSQPWNVFGRDLGKEDPKSHCQKRLCTRKAPEVDYKAAIHGQKVPIASGLTLRDFNTSLLGSRHTLLLLASAKSYEACGPSSFEA